MENVIGNIPGLIAEARERGIPIIYIRIAFRGSFTDVMPEKPMIVERNMLRELERGVDVIDDLRPQPLDAIVTKRRTGAFYMTDLELLLRRLGAEKLIVTGMSTARAVESTVREAHGRDLKCVVVSDGCLADSEKVHDNALQSMGDWFAEIAMAAHVRATYLNA